MTITSVSERIRKRVSASLLNFRIYLRLDKKGRAERKAIFSELKNHSDWLKQVPAYDLERYREAVRDLPRPSPEQIDDFVQFVSEAHSWYKHLPWVRPGWFQFYLNPYVAYDSQQLDDGSVRLLERTGDMGFHYTWMTTKRYRKRFGYLAYHCDGATDFLLQTGGDTLRYGEPKALAYTRKGEPFFVPAELGCVLLSGVIHRYASKSSSFWAWHAPPDEVTPERLARVNRAKMFGGNDDDPLYVEVDALLRPERERQRGKMRRTITQMLETLGPQG